MSGELSFYGDTEAESGLTVVGRVYNSAGTQVSTDVATTEVGILAIYIGDMPTAGAGVYAVRFFDGTVLIGQGTIDWDGAAETTLVDVTPLVVELHAIAGLDILNPMTVTPTSRVSGSVSQTISGDGETTSTVTRD